MSLLDDISKIENGLHTTLADLAALKVKIPIEMVHPPEPAQSTVRRSAGVDKLRIQVATIKQPNQVWRLTHLWTTFNGSWELSGQSIYCIPDWARDEFMRFFPMAGGDHNIFALMLGADGKPQPNKPVRVWYKDGSVSVLTNSNGFAEKDIYGSFNPDDINQSGAWSVSPMGNPADIASGMGMPMNHHVSLFGVWRWFP